MNVIANGALSLELYPWAPLVWRRRRLTVPRRARSWVSSWRLLVALPLVGLLYGVVEMPWSLEVLQGDSPYSIVGATETEREVFAEIHRRYVEAGLELPNPIRVEFSEGTSVCGEHRGRYIYESDTIHFCRRDGEDWVFFPKLVIHELAHAWDDHNMNEESRQAYKAHLEIDESTGWLDADVPHAERPAERFAGTVGGVLQGVIDRARLDAMIGQQ